MKTISIQAVAVALVLACNAAVAKDEPAVASLKETFSKVPAPEVPAKAADLVAQTKPSARDAVAADVVTAALKKHPTMAMAIVGATSRKAPETSPVVAGTAAGIQPKQAALIAQAAAAAAPSKAGDIVKAVCKVVPSAYREVALAVAQVAPNSAKEILAGLSEALPALKSSIEQASASYRGQMLSVVAVLDRVATFNAPVASTSRAPLISPPSRPPGIGGPYVGISSTPTNAPPGNAVVAGSRDYGSP